MELYKIGAVKREMRERYITQYLFPRRNISLIGGSSGAGKTTWVAQFIDAWSVGEPTYGYENYPLPFMYISSDRSKDSLDETMERIVIDAKSWPTLVPSTSAERKMPLLAYLEKAAREFPDKRVYFIEGLHSRVPNGKFSDYNVVAHFLLDLREFCERHDVTIVGIVHKAKTKEGEDYNDPREKALGSVAWASYTEGMVFIERMSKNQADPQRRVFLLPRNGPTRILKMYFEGGQLLLSEDNTRPTNVLKALKFVGEVAVGELFHTGEAQARTGLKKSSLHLELGKLLVFNVLKRGGARGEYYRVGSDEAVATLVRKFNGAGSGCAFERALSAAEDAGEGENEGEEGDNE